MFNNFTPNPNGLLYKEVYSHIRSAILDGSLPAQSRLPSERKLCAIFSISRTTLQKALNELLKEGLITINPRSGAYVKPPETKNIWISLFKKGHLSTINKSADILRKTLCLSGSDIINLSSAKLNPEFNAHKCYTEGLKNIIPEIEGEIKGYNDRQGIMPLREEVCRRIASYGINAKPEQVLILSSRFQAHSIIIDSFITKGITCYTERIGIYSGHSLLKSLNARIVPIDIDKDGLDTKHLLKEISKQSNIIITDPSNHNPTGTVMPISRRNELLNIANNNSTPIIETDVMRDHWLDEPYPAPIKALPKSDNVIYIGGFSKTISSGIRIVWLVADELAINYFTDMRLHRDMHTSLILQLAAYNVLKTGLYDEFLGEMRVKLQKRKVIADFLIDRYLKSIVERYINSGFYIWLTFKKEVDIQRAYEMRSDVDFMPGFLYSQADKHSISICPAAVTEDELEKGLIRLKNLLVKFVI